MKNFIPKEKLNKKAKRTLDAERRTLWDVSPVSKKIESKKHYNRKKNAHARYDEGMSVFV